MAKKNEQLTKYDFMGFTVATLFVVGLVAGFIYLAFIKDYPDYSSVTTCIENNQIFFQYTIEKEDKGNRSWVANNGTFIEVEGKALYFAPSFKCYIDKREIKKDEQENPSAE